MNVLVRSNNCIGDHIAYVLPVCKYLHRQGHIVDCMVCNPNVTKLLENVPYFRKLIKIPYDDDLHENLAKESIKIFLNYDRVYVCSRHIFNKFKAIIGVPNIVDERICIDTDTDYWPVEIMNRFDMAYNQGDILIDINWYSGYHRDFKCDNKSVLLHTASNVDFRTYLKKDQLKSLLIDQGFTVMEIDVSEDIRTNLHLINQVRHILTVDTSVFWMGRSLGKEPFVFLHQSPSGHRRFSEKMLNVKNLVPWYDHLNDIPPKLIVDCFVEKVKGTLL